MIGALVNLVVYLMVVGLIVLLWPNGSCCSRLNWLMMPPTIDVLC